MEHTSKYVPGATKNDRRMRVSYCFVPIVLRHKAPFNNTQPDEAERAMKSSTAADSVETLSEPLAFEIDLLDPFCCRCVENALGKKFTG
jgi:hypothetical protein